MTGGSLHATIGMTQSQSILLVMMKYRISRFARGAESYSKYRLPMPGPATPCEIASNLGLPRVGVNSTLYLHRLPNLISCYVLIPRCRVFRDGDDPEPLVPIENGIHMMIWDY